MHTAAAPAKKILIVDDNASINELFKEYFECMGYAAEVARNGQEGVEKYKSVCPDIVLMDMQMPVMNGYESSKGIKTYDPQAKILMVTGHPFDRFACKSLAEGYVKTIIPKPCDLDRLHTAVCNTLAQ